MLNSKNLCGRQYSSYGSASRAIKIVEKREGICFDKASINQLDETCFEVLINQDISKLIIIFVVWDFFCIFVSYDNC